MRFRVLAIAVGLGVAVLFEWWPEPGTVATARSNQGDRRSDAPSTAGRSDVVDPRPTPSAREPAAEAGRITRESAEPSTELAERVALEIRIQGNAGAPVLVELWHSDPGPDFPRRETAYATDGEGRLEVRLPPGMVRISAYSGIRVALPLEVELERGRDRAVYLELVDGCPVEGTVVDAFSRIPLEGARVQVRLLQERSDVRTNAFGWYQVWLPADRSSYQIVCQAPGYGIDLATVGFGEGGSWTRDLPGPVDVAYDVEHPEGHGTALVDFELVPEGSLQGEVVGPGSAPAAGATVSARGHFWSGYGVASPHSASATVAPDGRFVLSGVRPDITYFLSVDLEGCATAQLAVPPSGSEARSVGVIALERPCRWTGQVVDARGVGVEDLLVRLERPFAAPEPSRPGLSKDCPLLGFPPLEVVTAEEGRFSFDRAPPTLLELSVVLDVRTLHRQSIDLTGLESSLEAIQLARPLYAIEGSVVGAAGPVSGATVMLEWSQMLRTTLSDATGSFAFRGLEDAGAAYRVRAELDDGSSSEPQDVRAGEGPILLSCGSP